MKQILCGLALLCWFSAAEAQTTCPPLPNQILVSVTANVALDPSTQLYTYIYTVASDASSVQNVVDLAVNFEGSISNINDPQGWDHGIMFNNSTVRWSADVAADFPPGTTDQGQVPPSAFPVTPGTSMTGFSFVSQKPPGPVKYFAHGYSPLPPQASESDAEQFSTVCGLKGSYMDRGLTGTTSGPVNFIPVNILIKAPAAPPAPMNPGDRGTVPVAILGSGTFDASTVDASSLLLGPGDASVFSPGNSGGSQSNLEDVNGDGFPDMVVHFRNQQIGYQCGSMSLLLTGKTTTGTPIRGSETIQTVNCQP